MPLPASVSTIYEARANLYGFLVADAPDRTANVATQVPQPIQICYGPPASEEMEVVALLGVRSVDDESATLGAGPQRRRETYELEIGVKVHNPAAGAGSEAAMVVDARGFELCKWVRTVVHGHWTLGQAVRHAQVTSEVTEGVQLAEKGCLFFSVLTVTCIADVVYDEAAP